MPNFSLGLALGLTQEFQEGDEKIDEEGCYDSKATGDDNNILGIKDDEEGRRDVGKWFKKPSMYASSPYNQKKKNLEEPTFDVIDNMNLVANFSRAYRDALDELKLLLSSYVMSVNHKSTLNLEGVQP
ncbi:unnamed protein product [Lactuca virosa]|uniref:Uncharacterized protein n=1 Tax=Lactuca virosa TaxID=75947 RepID=A0AAU9N627_9ASTR|nr:unnamed protein product [Lactuca virosa]